MQFKNLPPVVLYEVLCNLDSPLALLSAIEAIPSFHEIFQWKSLQIVSAVLGNFAEPEVVSHAVAAVVAPGVRSSYDNPEVEENFLRWYFEKDGPLTEIFVLDKHNMLDVVRMAARVEWLIDDFVKFGLREMDAGPEVPEPKRFLKELNELAQIYPEAVSRFEGSNPGFSNYLLNKFSLLTDELDCWHYYQSVMSDRDPTGLISKTERSRLQRTFFMFAVFTEWFAPEDRSSPHARESTQVQYDTFVAQLLPWEVEQLICVHDYLKARLVGIFDDVENEIMEKLDYAAREQRSRGATDNILDVTILGNDLCHQGGPLPFISEESRHLAHKQIAPLTMLGLGFLYGLLSADHTTRKELIRRQGCLVRKDYLTRAIKRCPAVPRLETMADLGTTADHLRLENANDDNFRGADFEAYVDIWQDASDEDLSVRKRGFIFWDLPRSLQDDISWNAMPTEEEFVLRPAPLRRKNVRSAQHKFGRVRIPLEAARQIFDEYAWMAEPCPTWYVQGREE